MYSMGGRRKFEALVRQALEDLPEDIEKVMTNIDIVVEDQPTHKLATELGTERENLLGLYQGIPLTERGESYFGVLPDRIALYQSNIERSARSRQELKQIVRRTVLHEIAHHFGIDDERLDELGWA